MNIALRTTMTLQQFLAWEDRQQLRYEFDGIRPIAMTGGTVAHSSIQGNVVAALTSRLRGKPCRPHGSHLKIEVAGSIRYPDAFVVCSPARSQAKLVQDPVVVFEILSPSTTNEDLVVKNAEYRATPSVQRYIILEQTHRAALMFRRSGEDWVSEVVAGEGATLSMPEIGIEVPLAEFYLDVELPGEPSDDDQTAA